MRLSSLLLVVVVAIVLLAGCPKPQPGQGTAAPGDAGLPKPPGSAKAPDASSATPGAALSGEIKAYIPCGMIIPMRAVITQFETKNPDAKVTGVYDNAGIIVKRLTEKGEAADVVVSPGKTEMAKLDAAGLIDSATQQTVGTFELVCIVPSSSTKAIAKPADLKQCKTIAMPNPDVNSTGTSGRDALTKLGLYDALKSRMLLPNHAIEAHTMVAAKKADAGIAYRNCPLETNPDKLSKSKVKIAFAFPADSYEQQPCLIASSTKAANKALADAFVDFMASDEGRKILAANGMTGCLTMPAATEAGKDAAAPAAPANPNAAVKVVAYYPGNEKHKPIRAMVEGLGKKYGDKVSGRFVAFDTDEGFKEWHDEKGLTCGAILINDQQTWTYEAGGKVKEVTFKMAEGGEWTKADLFGVIEKLLKEKK